MTDFQKCFAIYSQNPLNSKNPAFKKMICLVEKPAESSDLFIEGHHYKVTGDHEYKNMVVSYEGPLDSETSRVSYPFWRGKKFFTVKNTQLSEEVKVVDAEALFSSIQDPSNKKALLVDGNNTLYRAMFSYAQHRERGTDKFVGGSFGFYFNLLKLKEMFADYEIFVVFDGYDREKMTRNPDYKQGRQVRSDEFKKEFQANQDWVKRFVRALGYPLFHLSNKEADDVIGSLSRDLISKKGYKEVLIYSTDHDFYQLLTDNVSIYSPRVAYKKNPFFVREKQACEFFKVSDIFKINWVRALIGDASDNIISLNEYNNKYHKDLKIKKANYDEILAHINQISTEEEYIKYVYNIPNAKYFIEDGQFQKNFQLLQIDTNALSGLEIDDFRSSFDEDVLLSLLEENSFYKEIELWDKNRRIFQSIW